MPDCNHRPLQRVWRPGRHNGLADQRTADSRPTSGSACSRTSSGPPGSCGGSLPRSRAAGSARPPGRRRGIATRGSLRRSIRRSRSSRTSLDRRGETVGGLAGRARRGRNRRRHPVRREARDVQRLADVDVAEPGHHPLIEQGDFQRRLLAAQRGASAAPSNSVDNGSGPRPAERRMRVERAGGHRSMKPKRRGSLKITVRPTTARRPHGRGGRRRRSRPPVGGAYGSTRNDPDMPRCITSVSPDDRSARRYFARRASLATVAPFQSGAEARGKWCARSERWRVTVRIRAHHDCGQNWRRRLRLRAALAGDVGDFYYA